MQDRIAQVADTISSKPQIKRCELHSLFCDKFKIHWVTVDRLVIRARRLLLDRLGRSKEDFRSESLAFYESITNSTDATAGEKIRARQRIDELLGLDAPRQHELTGRDGNAIEVRSIPEVPRTIDRLNELLRVSQDIGLVE